MRASGLHLVLVGQLQLLQELGNELGTPPGSSRDPPSLLRLQLLTKYARFSRVGYRSSHAHLNQSGRRPHEKGLISPLMGLRHKNLPTCKNSYLAIGFGVESK